MPKPGDDTINALREALKFSPDNALLRKHLADVLIGFGRADEAERELRQAIAAAPGDQSLKLSLARVYVQLGRASHAVVILEDLAKYNPAAMTPAARVVFAAALHRTGEAQRAAFQYREAVDADPSAADPALAEQLGTPAQAPAPSETPQREAPLTHLEISASQCHACLQVAGFLRRDGLPLGDRLDVLLIDDSIGEVVCRAQY